MEMMRLGHLGEVFRGQRAGFGNQLEVGDEGNGGIKNDSQVSGSTE